MILYSDLGKRIIRHNSVPEIGLKFYPDVGQFLAGPHLHISKLKA
jgi:hypothetical protein